MLSGIFFLLISYLTGVKLLRIYSFEVIFRIYSEYYTFFMTVFNIILIFCPFAFFHYNLFISYPPGTHPIIDSNLNCPIIAIFIFQSVAAKVLKYCINFTTYRGEFESASGKFGKLKSDVC